MKKHRWEIAFGVILIAVSALLFGAHWLIFGDFHHIAIYTVHDIAFLPMEVLLVTFVLHRLLESREKTAMLKKLNMVIGAFFSEVGTELMQKLSVLCPELPSVRKDLIPKGAWTKKDFIAAGNHLTKNEHAIEADVAALEAIKPFLVEKRSFLLVLLENPNLLEHESFTNLLWAVFHLVEELIHRKDVKSLPKSDVQHIAGDMKRVYGQLISQWILYMGHLKQDYPYLFSLAARTNPFDAEASAEVAG